MCDTYMSNTCRLFRNVVLPPSEKPQVKIPSKLKEALKAAKQQMEQRLCDEQKLVGVTSTVAPWELARRKKSYWKSNCF